MEDVERGGSKKFWRKAAIALGLMAWVFVSFMAVQLLFAGALFVMKLSGVSFESVNEAVFSASAGIIIYSLTILVAIGVPWLLRRKTTLKELGLDRFVGWKDYGWLGAGAVTYIILTVVISTIAMALMPFIDFEQKQTTGYESVAHSYEYVLAFIGLVVIAPVAEEVLFRGYLFGKLRKAKIKTWVSVLLVSLLFAIVHFQGNVGVDVFALSIVLCLLRIFSGSLWPSIMLHMLKNGVAFYFLFVNPSILSTLGG
ncbi:CPBP family intramembrane metalloprotease [Candidatus Saccharibacteria bacterium TM7i]|nr:CPBP family intramembrane metalloprotease [Candidatus Saccharibacteria bacterium TM7i]